mgnify:CR=1 FL=1
MVVMENSGLAELAKLSLGHSGNKDTDFVDITEHLHTLSANLAPETVVKEPTFSLFEGTYALEVCNLKLDTSLIELSPEEQTFDCNIAYGEEQNLEYVTAICDRLSRSLMNWLHDYQTLPTTVLSCRYVEYLMELYTKHPVSSLDAMQGLSTQDPLYDQVLYSFVLGLCSFIKFTSIVLKDGGVYEEEDLNCNVMNLDMLSKIEYTAVIQSLDTSLRVIDQLYPDPNSDASHLRNVVRLLRFLLHIPNYHYPSRLTAVSSDLSVLQESLEVIAELNADNYDFTQHKCPPGCFSMGIQKRRDNNFPPKEIYQPNGNEFQSFDIFMRDILAALSVKNCETAFEFRQYVWFFNRLHQRTVMARALLQSYLMRNEMILDRFSVDNFSNMHLHEFSLAGTTLSDILSNEENSIEKADIHNALSELSYCLLRWYQNMPQNCCRHRQGFNRLLLDFDSVQANFEQHETHWQSIGIDDRITKMGGAPLMPVSTWIYTTKLLMMIEFTLEGFHLEVYKPWESFAQYWFCYYLSSHLESNLKRLQEFLLQKINYIGNYNKKIKKLKAGEKKEKAKEQYKHLISSVLPQLKLNKKTISYLFLVCTVLKSLSLAQVFQFALLKSFKIIDSTVEYSTRFSTKKMVHDLRFKTFSSIGIPEVPTFEQFQKSLEDFVIESPAIHSKIPNLLNFMNTELENAKIALSTIIRTIETGEPEDAPIYTGTKQVKETALQWFNSLLGSATALSVNGSVLKKKILEHPKTDNLSQFYDVKLTHSQRGCYYFPILTLSSKLDRKRK